VGKLEKLGCPKQLDNLTNFFTGCSRENPGFGREKTPFGRENTGKNVKFFSWLF